MAPTTPAPFFNRDIVLYLEVMLDRARKGEIQFLIASSSRVPMTPEGWGSLDVEGFAAFGPLVPRLDETSLRNAHAKTLEGLAGAVGHADAAFKALLGRFEPVLSSPEHAAQPEGEP